MRSSSRAGRSARRWIGPIAVVAVVAFVGVVLLWPGGDRSPDTANLTDPSASADAAVASGDPSAPGESATTEPLPTVIPVPGHEVYGFVPYWEMDGSIADHIGRTDLTTLGLFSVTHRRTGELATNQNGYKRITGAVGKDLIRTAHRRGMRVEIVYSSFGEAKNRRFYDRPAAQERWIRELVEMVDDTGTDGINVDVELLPADLVPAYGAFVGQLREALLDRLPDAQLSVATQANENGAAMAAAAADAGADRIFLMGYDYHWAGSNPGASAPIDRLDGRPRDLVWSLDMYAGLGVPVDRTLLGLPLYGMTWPVVGPGLGADNYGRGQPWVPRRNLATLKDSDFEPTYDPIESVEFYAVRDRDAVVPTPEADPDATDDPDATPDSDADVEGAWNAVYYDSPRSLAPKLALADARGLAGVGFWAIGYERGLPGYRQLIKTFRAGDLESSAAP